MGRIFIRLPDDLEKEFREEVVRCFGGKKGSLSKAVEEAIRLWMRMKKQV
ncbi:MAG: hypothetical protein QXW41_09410 [Fervidicoccaceae archaeon]